MSADLFSPFRMGDIELANRVVMAPLTRNRATPGADAPNDLNVEYYRQRAGAGLIVSEAAQISRQGQGYLWTPGIYTDAQVAGWRKITDAVHEAGGKIVIQLWHVGRVSHTSLQPDGQAPVAPSAIVAKTKTFIEGGFADTSMPRALDLTEIPGIIADYRRAAENAKKAGFDGVELHGANGYLIDQFLKDGSNHRADAYGGSVGNRMRFALEAVDAVLSVWPASRVGIRLSPVSPANDAVDSAPDNVFFPLVRELDKRGLAFIHVIEGSTGAARDNAPFDYAGLRKSFRGAYMANNGYTREMAIEAVAAGRADLVSFGKAFIANPDLVERLRRDAPLNDLDRKTLYGGDARGYTDYPALATAAE
jgi:N-ethylmaleimide reductase